MSDDSFMKPEGDNAMAGGAGGKSGFDPVIELSGVTCTLTRAYREGESLGSKEIKVEQKETGRQAVYKMGSYIP